MGERSGVTGCVVAWFGVLMPPLRFSSLGVSSVLRDVGCSCKICNNVNGKADLQTIFGKLFGKVCVSAAALRSHNHTLTNITSTLLTRNTVGVRDKNLLGREIQI